MSVSSIIVALLLAAPGGGGSETRVAPLIADADLQTAGMYRYWDALLPLSPGDRLVAGHLVDDSLYVVTESGLVFSLDASFGLIRWGHHVTQRDYAVYPPAHLRRADGAGPVVIVTTARTLIYDRYSGDLIHAFDPPFPPGTSAVGYDDRLFFGSSDGRLHSLQLAGPGGARPFKRWEVATGGPVTAAPRLFAEETLIFGSQSGWLFSCLGEDKTLLWSFRTGGPILGDPAVDETGVYVASADRSLYKLDHSGQLLWRLRLPRPLLQSPVLAARTVYQPIRGLGIVAVDAASGAQRWRMPGAAAFVAHHLQTDFLFTTDRRLLAVDHQSGSLQREFPTVGTVGAVVNTRDDAVFLLGGAGQVVCARVSDVPYLRIQQVTAARARLNQPPDPSTGADRRDDLLERQRPGPLDPFRSRRDRQD